MIIYGLRRKKQIEGETEKNKQGNKNKEKADKYSRTNREVEEALPPDRGYTSLNVSRACNFFF